MGSMQSEQEVILTQQERNYLNERVSAKYISRRRVILLFALILFTVALYKHIDYLALAAIIGMIIKQIYETWNGDPLVNILNKLVKQVDNS